MRIHCGVVFGALIAVIALVPALDAAHRVLTAEQWKKVPDSVKNPGRGPGQGRPGGRRGP